MALWTVEIPDEHGVKRADSAVKRKCSPYLERKQKKIVISVCSKTPKNVVQKNNPQKKAPFGLNFFFTSLPIVFCCRNLLHSTPLGRFSGGRATLNLDQIETRGAKRLSMSSALAGPQGPAVVASGWCRRKVYAGVGEYEVVLTWAPHESGLKLITTVVNPNKRGHVGSRIITYPAA